MEGGFGTEEVIYANTHFICNLDKRAIIMACLYFMTLSANCNLGENIFALDFALCVHRKQLRVCPINARHNKKGNVP